MEPWVREVVDNRDNILYVDSKAFYMSRGLRLHAFGGISSQGSTLLGLSQSRNLPDMFQGIVLPYIDTMGQHSIFHDDCPMYRGYRIRQILELNGIAHFSVQSEAAGTQPMEVVWSLAQQCLHESQPVTMDQMRDNLAVFGLDSLGVLLIHALMTL